MRWLIGGLMAVTGANAATAQGIAQESDLPPASADAPRGTSGTGEGAVRIDDVGYATLDAAVTTGPTIGHPVLPVGSVAEVTAIDTGRTILLDVVRGGGQGMFPLSAPAAAALGMDASGRAAVRVRPVIASGQDIAALRAGIPPVRLDAPAALLTGLKKRLVPAPQPTIATSTPMPILQPPPSPAKPAQTGIHVQVATLSSRERADALAASLGGQVSAVGSLFRVRIGPYPDRAAADRARAGVSARGFTDARIVESR